MHQPELIQQGFMRQEIDIFDMVVGLVPALGLFFRLPWRDALQDA